MNEENYNRRKAILNRATYNNRMHSPFDEDIYLHGGTIKQKERSEQQEKRDQIQAATDYAHRIDWHDRMAKNVLMVVFFAMVVVLYFFGFFS